MPTMLGRACSILYGKRTVSTTKSPSNLDLDHPDGKELTPKTETKVKRLSQLSNPETLTPRGRAIRESLLSIYDMGTPEDGIQASLALIADAEANPQEDGEETNELELLMNWAEELRRDIEWLGNNGDHEYRAANKIAMERIRAERKAEKQAWRERHADEIEAELAKRRAEGNTDTGESLETLEVMGIARFSPLEDVED